MKKILLLWIMALCVFTGCAASQHSLDHGMYVPGQIEDNPVNVPYILIDSPSFSVIGDSAVSYQPSGNYETEGNKVIMKTVFADEECVWTFVLTDDNTLKYSAKDSVLPSSWEEWQDGTVFIKAKE